MDEERTSRPESDEWGLAERELALLLDVSRILSSSLTIDYVLQNSIEAATRVLGIESGAVYLLEGETLLLGATTPPLPPEMPRELLEADIADHPHIARALATRRPLLVPNLRAVELTDAERQIVDERNLVSILYVPILMEGDPIGVLIVGSTHEIHDFDEHQTLLADTLSNHVALAVANSRLYDSLQRSHLGLEAAVEKRTQELKTANEELDLTNEELQSSNEELESITEELQSTLEELETANHELLSANEAKSQFMAGMSHELRTPLNSIIGFAGILAHGMAGPLTGEQMRQLKMIRQSGERLLELVNGVLDLTKVESGHVTIALEQVDVVEAVHDVVGMLRPLADEAGIELTVFDPEVSCATRTDPGKLSQILFNLIGNALKFTEVGSVKVTVKRVPTGISVTVQDTGIGIPQEVQDELFEPFTQVAPRSGPKPQGTGLGLALSREYAQMLGGDITFESELGLGSTFVLTIPDTA